MIALEEEKEIKLKYTFVLLGTEPKADTGTLLWR